MYKTGKKLLSLLLAVSMLLAMCVTAGAKNDGVTVTLDGKTITTEAYIDANGRTQVPNAVAEKLGVTLTLKAGDAAGDTSVVDGYFPLRYVAEANGYQVAWDGSSRTAKLTSAFAHSSVAVDTANKALYAADETETQSKFGWYTWTFDIDPTIDTVGTVGDGKGVLYFRLYVPENTEQGKQYPLVATLGGLGSTNAFANNGYAAKGLAFAADANQAENPSYVLNITVPFEACVNYEAELAYIYQFGEIIKAVAASYGNVDMNRIYATGHSQGAGWSYELAAVQPDLLAAVLINAGTTVHTTWGNQCDMEAIAKSDVNIYIWHGYIDPYIPVNDAYRAFNTLVELGKTNIIMEIDNCEEIVSWGGHCNMNVYSEESVTTYMKWLYSQKKGVACTDNPVLNEDDEHSQYKWAGYLVLPEYGENWTTIHNYAEWTEPAENDAWTAVKANSKYVDGKGGTGKTWLSKIRIGDETSTSYDDATKDEPTVTIASGDTVAVTVQGYTGGYGDDWDAFNKEWTVEWAVLEGSVTNIELTHAASASPILRPASVSLANGGGPNVNNSLYNENALDGNQVYVKIDTAEDFEGDTLKVAIRFVRDLGDGEYASYWHVVTYNVK